MFCGNNVKNIFFVLLICLLFSTIAEAFTDGDDITAAGFSWGAIGANYPMYYVDSSNYVRKKMVKAYKVSDHYYDPSHCYTTENRGIPHVHFEFELGNGGLPTHTQVNKYFDARFQCGEITYEYELNSASTKQNCHAFAFYTAFDGIYEYWVEGTGIVFSDDAHTVSTIQSYDVIFYGNGDPQNTHSTLYASGGGNELLVWKWAYSQVYIKDDPEPDCYSTPKYVGGVWYNPDNNSKPAHTISYNISHWTWSETGGGNYCVADTYVKRKN